MLKKLSTKITENQIAFGLKTATVLAATVALFSQDLIILFNDAIQS